MGTLAVDELISVLIKQCGLKITFESFSISKCKFVSYKL